MKVSALFEKFHDILKWAVKRIQNVFHGVSHGNRVPALSMNRNLNRNQKSAVKREKNFNIINWNDIDCVRNWHLDRRSKQNALRVLKGKIVVFCRLPVRPDKALVRSDMNHGVVNQLLCKGIREGKSFISDEETFTLALCTAGEKQPKVGNLAVFFDESRNIAYFVFFLDIWGGDEECRRLDCTVFIAATYKPTTGPIIVCRDFCRRILYATNNMGESKTS